MSEQLDRMEKYLLGQMATEDRQDFEAELLRDAKLRKDFNRLKLIHDALEVDVEDQLRAQLGKLANRKKNLNQAKKLSLPVIWALAASIMILLAASIWWFTGSELVDPAQYSAEQYVEYTSTKLRTEENNHAYSPLLRLLNQGDTSTAIKWLERWMVDNREDWEAAFFLADLHYKSGTWEQAKALFLQINESSSILWSEKSAWNFLAISAQESWDTQADAMLEEILKDPNHSYYNEVNKLLKMRH